MTFRELLALSLNVLAQKIAPEPKCDNCGDGLPDHIHQLDQPVFEYFTHNNPTALEVNLCDECAPKYFAELTTYYNQATYSAHKAAEARLN